MDTSHLASACTAKTSDFEKILTTLNQEIRKAAELSSRTGYMANRLKKMDMPPLEIRPSEPNEDSAIDILWLRINELRDINQYMEFVSTHLEGTLGA